MNIEEIIGSIQNVVDSAEPVSNDILKLMLDNIGNTSPELRDDTIYTGFRVILQENRLTDRQKEGVLKTIINNNLLFSGIDEVYSDQVFTRSFTALLLVQIFNNHFSENWIAPSTEKKLVEMAVRYLNGELDNRGYLEQKGWAHAFAHGADLLGMATHSSFFGNLESEEALKGIYHSIVEIENFLYGEEGRLARASTKLLSNGKVTDSVFANWLRQITHRFEESPQYNVCWKNYLMSLYFNLANENTACILTMQSIENALNIYYRQFHCF